MFTQCDSNRLMAYRSKQVCCKAGCKAAQVGPYCAEHQAEVSRAVEVRRGSRHTRGYNHEWTSIRERHIKARPLCNHCEQRGRVTPGVDVDHIRPFVSMTDPLRLDPANLQTLCRDCHNAKTASDRINSNPDFRS